MQQIGTLFATCGTPARERRSERGDLLAFFADGVNRDRDGRRFKKLGVGYFAVRLQGLSMRDLYYMKSVIESEVRRGQSFGRVFFGMLKPRI